jgi:hypothetical protein
MGRGHQYQEGALGEGFGEEGCEGEGLGGHLFGTAEPHLESVRFSPQLSPGKPHLGGGFALTVPLTWHVGAVLAGYVVLMLSYTFVLKHMVLMDMMAIGTGFVLRAMAGALAIDVPISPWLYVVTALAALFLVIHKRRA